MIVQTTAYTFLDRTGWLCGPWDNEPDIFQWRDETTRLLCLARRTKRGSFCGYAAVGTDHPLYGRQRHEISEVVEASGGVSYVTFTNRALRICNDEEVGEFVPLFWIGFDCGHAWEVIPEELAMWQRKGIVVGQGQEYRTLEYVKKECTLLAAQLHLIRE